VLLAADMNGDGADELIASERDRGRLHMWMGAAAGPSTPRYVELGGEAIALVTGRFRGDGGPQLAAAIPVLGEVARFEFSPSVGLERAGTAWAAGFPASLATADIDEDGDDDLAALDTLDRTLWVGLGDGAGGWHDEYTWPLAETPRRVFARRGPAGPELGVIRGDGHGVTLIDPFTGVARIEAVAAGPVQDLVVGDFAAGGSEELVYLHEKVAMAKDIAGFRAQPRWMAPAAGATGQVAVLDLDGDDVPELVVEDTSQPALVVFAGAGSQYVELTRYPLPGPPHGLRPLPRADGGADLVWWQSATFGTPSPLGVLTYVPGEGLAEVATVALDEPILDIVAADLDDDGWADLAVTVRLAGEDAHDALVLVTREPGALTIGPRLLEGEPIESVVAAQIDGVGGEDLWVMGGWDVWSVLGPLDAPTPLESRVWIGHGEVFVAADLNGDAQPDLIACSGYGVEVAYAHPDGTTDPPAAISSTACERLTPCDLDADGELELVIERRIDDARRNAVEVLRADALGWLTAGAFADAPDLEQTASPCRSPAATSSSSAPSSSTADRGGSCSRGSSRSGSMTPRRWCGRCGRGSWWCSGRSPRASRRSVTSTATAATICSSPVSRRGSWGSAPRARRSRAGSRSTPRCSRRWTSLAPRTSTATAATTCCCCARPGAAAASRCCAASATASRRRARGRSRPGSTSTTSASVMPMATARPTSSTSANAR
jgi:hypothetical protein